MHTRLPGWVINGPRAMSRPRPLLPQERRKRRHSVTSHSCHKRKMPAACVQVRFLLIGVFGVVTEAKALAQEVYDFHTVGMRGVQRFRQVHRTLYRRTGSRSTKFGFLDLSSKRRPSVGSAFNTCNCLGIGGASDLAQPLCRLPMAVFCGDHVCKPYRHIFHTYRTDKRPVDNVCFSNRPFGVKRFLTVRHRCSVDVARGLMLLFGIGTRALPS